MADANEKELKHGAFVDVARREVGVVAVIAAGVLASFLLAGAVIAVAELVARLLRLGDSPALNRLGAAFEWSGVLTGLVAWIFTMWRQVRLAVRLIRRL